MLFQRTGVHILVFHADERGHNRSHKHIAPLLVVQIDFKPEPVIEPAHLDAYILLVRGFPTGVKVGGGVLHYVAVAVLRPRGVVEPVAR